MTTPTSNAVPSKDPRDLLFNAEMIDVVVNTSEPSYRDRKGIERLTLAGAIASLAAYSLRGNWLTATAYFLKDLAQSGDDWYICTRAHTSGTFATDLAAGRWVLYQGLTAADVEDASINAALSTTKSGSGGTDYSTMSYLSRKLIQVHAWYAFLANDIVEYLGGAPLYGHASFNDNVTIQGVVDSDHHISFQSRPHYDASALVAEVTSFDSLIDATDGNIQQAAGVKVGNALGSGEIQSFYGVKVEYLTRGDVNNYGVYVAGAAAGSGRNYAFFSAGVGVDSYLGGNLVFASGASGPAAVIGYSSTLGHLLMYPAVGKNIKVSGESGNRKLRIGSNATDDEDAIIENASDGHLKISPRSTYATKLMAQDFYVEEAGKGIVLKNAAGTITRRVRLSSDGASLVIEPV